MSDNSNAKLTVITAVIGALGALAAAMVPMFLSQRNETAPSAAAAPAPSPDVATGPAPPPVAATKPAQAPKPAPAAPASKGGGALAKAHADLIDDSSQIQGRWRLVGQHTRTKDMASGEIAALQAAWSFSGDKLRTHRTVNGKTVEFEGKFKARRTPGGRGLFDAALVGIQSKKPAEWVGIYEITGDQLKICYHSRALPDGPAPARPKDFSVGADEKEVSLEFQRSTQP